MNIYDLFEHGAISVALHTSELNLGDWQSRCSPYTGRFEPLLTSPLDWHKNETREDVAFSPKFQLEFLACNSICVISHFSVARPGERIVYCGTISPRLVISKMGTVPCLTTMTTVVGRHLERGRLVEPPGGKQE